MAQIGAKWSETNQLNNRWVTSNGSFWINDTFSAYFFVYLTHISTLLSPYLEGLAAHISLAHHWLKWNFLEVEKFWAEFPDLGGGGGSCLGGTFFWDIERDMVPLTLRSGFRFDARMDARM